MLYKEHIVLRCGIGTENPQVPSFLRKKKAEKDKQMLCDKR